MCFSPLPQGASTQKEKELKSFQLLNTWQTRPLEPNALLWESIAYITAFGKDYSSKL